MERSFSPPPPAARTIFPQSTASDGCGVPAMRLFRSVALVSGCTRIGGTCQKQPVRVYKVPSLHTFPEALASFILSFLTAKNICKAIRVVDRLWRQLSYDNGLWKELCVVVDKVSAMPENPTCSWEEIYLANPHVPEDFSKISFAVSVAQLRNGRVFVGAGNYCENLFIEGDSHIQATLSAKGKVFLTAKASSSDIPGVDIKGGTHFFGGISIMHDSKGHDLWNGNSAVFIEGEDTRVTFFDCAMTSASGRGLVAKNGSHVSLVNCAFENSAATGIYIGGPGATGSAAECIVRGNGKGGQRVMRGHSGVFLDRAKFTLSGCSVVNNHLSGISLVGPTASVLVENCEVKGNATIAIDAPEDKVEYRGKNHLVSHSVGAPSEGT